MDPGFSLGKQNFGVGKFEPPARVGHYPLPETRKAIILSHRARIP